MSGPTPEVIRVANNPAFWYAMWGRDYLFKSELEELDAYAIKDQEPVQANV